MAAGLRWLARVVRPAPLLHRARVLRFLLVAVAARTQFLLLRGRIVILGELDKPRLGRVLVEYHFLLTLVLRAVLL